MPNYHYKARDEAGKLVSGTQVTASKEMLASSLQQNRYTVISISESSDMFADINNYLKKFTKIKTTDLVMFNVQLSNMIGAGIALPTALLTLSDQIENPRLRDAVGNVYNDIKGGTTFSDSLKKYPDVFPRLFTNMVHAGEVAGNLDEILARLANFFEHDAELQQKISTAMFYPMILITLGIAIMIAIIVSVLPAFAKIFIDANVPLPLPTMVLYNLNLFMRAWWRHIGITIIALYFLFKWYKKTPTGKYTLDKLILRIPAVGSLTRDATIARLTRTLASLISSGVPMLQAIEVTENTIDNGIISKALRSVYNSVSKGETISKPLKESGEFPPMTTHMIAVGEETGALDTMLNKVADFYDMSTEYSLKKMTALIEPVFLVIIGGGVGFIFASILLPIFGMVKTLKH